MTPALRRAAMGAFITFVSSLTVRDRVTRQCPQTTTFFEEKVGKPKRNRTEVLLLTSLTNVLPPLGQTGSHAKHQSLSQFV